MMKKSVFKALLLLVLIPEILLILYISSRYTFKMEFSSTYISIAIAYLTFIVTNPFFLLAIVLFIFGMAILHFATQNR